MPLGPLQHYTIEPSTSTQPRTSIATCSASRTVTVRRSASPATGSTPAASPPVHLLGERKPREGIVVRGTEKKFADTGRFDHIAFAATDLPGVRERLQSRKVQVS